MKKKWNSCQKPIDMLVLSAINPIKGGKTAPPTIDITIKDEAFFVFAPKSLIPSANIVGNIIDMKKNTPKRLINDIQPSPPLIIGSNKTHAKA